MPRDMEITRHHGGRSPSRALDPVIAELAARQHTMVARRGLLDLGFGEDAIGSRAFHSHRRAFDDDRRRDRVLQHHGLRVARLTKRHLTLEAAATARDLGALLAQ